QIDGDEAIFVVSLNPLGVALGWAAEENEIAIFQLVVGDRENDGWLVADFGQRTGGCAGAVEQDHFGERKRSPAKDGLDLASDERERIDDAEPVAGGGFRIDHCGAICSTSSALRDG